MGKLHLNLLISCISGFLGLYLILNSSKNLIGWTEKGKKFKINWEIFKKYYYQNLKNSNDNQEFLNEGINHLPQLFALGVSKSSLLKNFSKSNNITDTYLFLKYVDLSSIKSIIREILAADGSFDPKYYNTSGNFVEGYGP